MPESYALDKKDKVLNILTVLEEVFLFRYAPTTPIPAKLWEGDEFCSVTKTKNELSIVAPQKRVVDSGMPKASAEHCGGPWNVLRVRGPLEHREYLIFLIKLLQKRSTLKVWGSPVSVLRLGAAAHG